MAKRLFALDFEVFGKVQGVFFRKYTEKQANQLGLRGWCMNTAEGTVKGQLEGPQNELNEMLVISFFVVVDKAVFTEMKPIDDYSFQAFGIKR
ncbi:acylphosphatase-2-like [Musca autumnalis]|uniref:acylphosphatase-2-like n=1 Tax=Musca autumnalis TaxID=221902 RepID=UPI003CEE223B